MISNLVVKQTYTGNGTARNWPIPFSYTDTSQIKVKLTVNGAETLVPSTDYTVDPVAQNVVYPKTADPIPATTKITLYRETAKTQATDLTNQGALYPETLEASFDKLTEIVQEQAEQISRAVKTQISSSASPDELMSELNTNVAAAISSAAEAANNQKAASSSAAAAIASQIAAAASATNAENAAATTATAVGTHNSDTDAHPDIRAALKKAGGVPIGTITARLSKKAEAGELALDTGALVSRATYPDLWAWVQSSGAPLISDADWQAQATAQTSVGAYSTGDGSTTFRLPRLLDYMRGGAAADVGTWQVDMFKSHTHDYDNMQGGGVANSVSDTTAAQTDATSQTGHITGSTGGTETRPKTIKVLYCVKAFDAETNPGLVDLTALANDVAGKVDKTTYAADFAQVLGTNGYKKLQGGLILQWGQATSNGTGVPNLSVTFPISFPNSCAVVTANANGNPNPGCFVEISSISKTAANMLVTTYNGSISSELVYWFAIGY